MIWDRIRGIEGMYKSIILIVVYVFKFGKEKSWDEDSEKVVGLINYRFLEDWRIIGVRILE